MPDNVMRNATDEDYNAYSRCILFKLDIFFDGISNPPLSVTRSDYLIDAELLEEAGAESSNPLGAVSANELSFSLYNDNGIFSPTNTASPYYGKIKTNVPIIPYMKPDDESVETKINWTKMGIYYVSDWNATVTGAAASVVANDKLQQVFLEATPLVPVRANQTFHDFFQDIFDSLGYAANVSSDLDECIPYTFVEDEPSKFIQEMCVGAISTCYCNKDGTITVSKLARSNTIRAILKDSDQVISVDAKQSISKTYGGVELTYSKPQLTEQIEVLSIKDLTIPTGIYTHSLVKFDKKPVRTVCSLSAVSDSTDVTISDYSSTPFDIVLTTTNVSDVCPCNVLVTGIALDLVDTVLSDLNQNPLKVSNKYIQTALYANKYKQILNNFVSSDLPVLTLTIRGNPLLNLGNTVQVISDKYALNFTGIVQRMLYKYTGSLSCDITLLNASVLEATK